jgi:Flp pilus assembly protein TadG
VEMALVAPLLVTLMFGAMELGYYFFSEHVVIKAVRDGARYASRRSFSNYTCPDDVDPGVVSEIQRVTRTNQVAAGGNPRLSSWTADATVDVALRCDTSGTYGAFYTGMAGVPVVVVTATVPYASILGAIGFDALNLQLQASSEVPVMGA